eukprot:gene34992-47017_t
MNSNTSSGFTSVPVAIMSTVPTDAVAGFCMATALLAALVHLAIETTVWPGSVTAWLAIVALGIGPVGAAFYAWDIGMKRGDIRVLGAASYATPLLSTAFLILAGYAQPTANIAVAAVLIAGGGLVAAKDMLRKKGARPLARLEGCGHERLRRILRGRRFATAPQDNGGACGTCEGIQPGGASSKVAKSKPGATVQPTRVQSPLVAAQRRRPAAGHRILQVS